MESIFLKEIKESYNKTMYQTSLQYGKIVFFNKNGNIFIIGTQCKKCKICSEMIWKKEGDCFENCGCFPKEINTCFYFPIVFDGECVGLVIYTARGAKTVVNSLVTEQLIIDNSMHELAKLSAVCFQRNYIKKVSSKLWGYTKSIVFLGSHQKIINVQQKLAHFAQAETPVLITGGSGVGKELYARSIYLLSKRNGNPFIAVNCVQYHNLNLMKSDLFGHKKGSFTGAIADHHGIFESADGGVVFLDEIGELPIEVQGIFLRVLEESEITPIGANRSSIINVRIITATNRNLSEMVKQGKFREDLYFRLDNLSLHLPSLHEQGDNWRILLEYFLKQLNKKYEKEKQFSQVALKLLENYYWPGNIREVKNIVASGFWNSYGKIIEAADIEKKLHDVKTTNISCNEFFSLNVTNIYNSLCKENESFWKIIREPFLARDLNRRTVKAVIKCGLVETNGSYKQLLDIWGIAGKDYKKFLNFLHQHKLQP